MSFKEFSNNLKLKIMPYLIFLGALVHKFVKIIELS